MNIPGSLHGACTRRRAVSELGEQAIRGALRNGLLRQPWRGILVPGDQALSPLTNTAAAWLAVGPDAVISGPTAAAMHGCDALESGEVHLTVPRQMAVRRKPGVRVHHGRIDWTDVVRVAHLPVFALDTVIADILCTARRSDALAGTDQALSGMPEHQRAGFVRRVRRRIEERPDPRGTRQAFALLRLADGKVESPPESWLRLLVIDAGFPVPTAQHWVLDIDDRELYRLDLSWPDLRIALEYNGYAAHAGRTAEDERRAEDLRRRGWIVITVTADDFRDPSRLFAEIRRAFARRGTVV